MGGVAGHLAHLYDNRDLTFNEMKKILTMASRGDLVGTEKTDGYNIFLGFKDNQPRYARNTGDMKAGGRNMEDLVAREFQGGPGVKKVYTDAFKAYTKAVRSMTQAEQAGVFGPEGHVFYNTEIQGPGASNLVNYDANVVSIHHGGHRWLNSETGKVEVIDVTQQSKKLDNLIQRFEQATSEEPFTVRRTAFMKLRELDGDHDLNIALSKIQKAGFTGSMTIEEFLEDYIRSVLDRKLSYLSGVTREQMTDRILDRREENGKPLITTTQIHKGFPLEQKKIISDAIKLGPQMIKEAIWPVEDAIHDFAVELLRGLESVYILDNETEVKRLKKEVEHAVKAIQKYTGPGSDEAHEILTKQLEKIKSHKNVNTAVEGFVFQYGDQMYKFTGNFAPANQILGLFKYGRKGIKIPKDESKQVMGETGLLNEEEGKTIALIPGKFKPPHRGHLDMVKHYAELAETVKILISPLPKDDITWEESKQIWEVYLQDALEDLSNVIVIKSPQNSPVGASFDYVENKNSDPDFAQDGDQVILGASTKGGDQSRFAGSVQKYADRNPMGNIKILNPMDYVFDPIPPELSATHFREALKMGDDISQWVPPESHGSIEGILNILGAEKKTLTMESLFSLVEEILTEKQLIKEAADETSKAFAGLSDTEKGLADLKAKSADALEKLAKSKETAANAAKSAIDVTKQRKSMLAQRKKSFEEIISAEEQISASEEAMAKASNMKQKAIKAKVGAAKVAQAAATAAIKLQDVATKAEEDKQSSMEGLQSAYEEASKVDQDLQAAYEESGEALTGASDAFKAAGDEVPAAEPGVPEPGASPEEEEEETSVTPAEKEAEKEEEAAAQKLDRLEKTQQDMQDKAKEQESEEEIEETSAGAAGSVAGAPGMGKREEETLIR
mgnify:CR=1 FL=1